MGIFGIDAATFFSILFIGFGLGFGAAKLIDVIVAFSRE